MSKKKENHEVLKQFESWRKTKPVAPCETFDGDVALIELFKYEPNNSKELGSEKTILIQDLQGNYVSSKTVLNSRFIPIGKILALGDKWSKSHEVGDLITVPSKDVLGPEVNSPEYLHLLQFSNSSAPPMKPEGMREKISSLESKWFNYMYYDPFDFASHDLETRRFVVPAVKVKGSWVGC